MDELTLLLRIGLAALLSFVLGLERELKGQPAGLRTHMLVAVGSCLFTLTGAYGFEGAAGQHPELMVDASRVGSQVVVGIGFLGGGAILRHGTNIRGLTTAANLWIAAAIGLTVAVGLYVAATITTLLVLFVLVGLKPLEEWIGRRRRRTPPGEVDDEQRELREDHR